MAIGRFFLWLILIPCLIVNSTLTLKSRYTCHTGSVLAHCTFGADQEQVDGLVETLLEEFQDFAEELPKTEKSKTNHTHSTNAAKAERGTLLSGATPAPESPPVNWSSLLAYHLNSYYVPGYYNFLFRLTPF